MSWRFTIHILDLEEFTDELTNELYESGCSDGTLASAGRRSHISFDRDAPGLQAAIRSAVDNIRRVGLEIARVEIVQQDLAPEELAQWQTA